MRKLIKALNGLYAKFYIFCLKHREIKKFRSKKRKKIYKTITLTKDQKKQIDFYFKKYYGKKFLILGIDITLLLLAVLIIDICRNYCVYHF